MADRIGLERRTSDFPNVDLLQGLRLGPLPTPEVLAPVMLDAYSGTPDYEGETLEETTGELCDILRGKYGAVVTAASFAAYDGETPVAAIVTVTEEDVPLVALVFTLPDYAGKRVASALLAAAANALDDAGCPTISLAVNPENARAARLYQHLGFTNAG